MTRRCDTCGEDFEPLTSEINCLDCKRFLKVEAQAKYKAKQKQLEGLDITKAVDKLMEIVLGSKKAIEEKVAFRELGVL